MTKDILLLDFDDCIGDFAPYICSYMNTIGNHAKIEDYKLYEFGDYHGLNHSEFKKCVVDSQAFRLLQPRPRAIEAIKLLREKGYFIVVVTSRGSFVNARLDTAEWLASHNVIVDDLKIVNPQIENKSDVYAQLGLERIVGLVDDAIHNLIDAEKVGIRPICIDRPWNYGHGETSNRFNSLFELATQLPTVIDKAA